MSINSVKVDVSVSLRWRKLVVYPLKCVKMSWQYYNFIRHTERIRNFLQTRVFISIVSGEIFTDVLFFRTVLLTKWEYYFLSELEPVVKLDNYTNRIEEILLRLPIILEGILSFCEIVGVYIICKWTGKGVLTYRNEWSWLTSRDFT